MECSNHFSNMLNWIMAAIKGTADWSFPHTTIRVQIGNDILFSLESRVLLSAGALVSFH
jgi:hypothetical protein